MLLTAEVKKNIKYLHIIRGFAALFVVLAHAKWPFWIGGTAYFAQNKFFTLSATEMIGTILALLSSNGTAMVIVFFVLSGFIISYSYQKNNWSYKNFLINRILRIYIPYIVSMVFAGTVLLYFVSFENEIFSVSLKDYNRTVYLSYEKGINLNNFLLSLFFYRSKANYFGFNYVYWSLLYEMVFYLLFPVIIRNIKQIFIVSLLLHPIHFVLNIDEMPNFYIFFFTKFLLYFSSGVLLYRVLEKGFTINMHPFFARKRFCQITIVSVFLIGIAAVGFIAHKSVSFIFAIIFTILWIIYILKYGAQSNSISKIFMFLGNISYSLYLIHVPCLLLFYVLVYKIWNISVYNSPWAHFAFSLLCLPFAYGFYKVFEVTSIKLIEKHKMKVIMPSNYKKENFSDSSVVIERSK